MKFFIQSWKHQSGTHSNKRILLGNIMDSIWLDFSNIAFTSPLLLTLKVAGLATLWALVLGVSAAYVLARWEFPGRDFLDAIFTLPMVMPPTVLGYYLLVFIGRRGILGSWLQEHFNITLMFTWQGAVIAARWSPFHLSSNRHGPLLRESAHNMKTRPALSDRASWPSSCASHSLWLSEVCYPVGCSPLHGPWENSVLPSW